MPGQRCNSENHAQGIGGLQWTTERRTRRDYLRVGSLSFLGISLSQFLKAKSLLAATGAQPKGKAQACILLWLEGGPSHVDTWDPQPNSSFKAISTNVPGIQVSEMLSRCVRHMDKLLIIRSMRSEEFDHLEGKLIDIIGKRLNQS